MVVGSLSVRWAGTTDALSIAFRRGAVVTRTDLRIIWRMIWDFRSHPSSLCHPERSEASRTNSKDPLFPDTPPTPPGILSSAQRTDADLGAICHI